MAPNEPLGLKPLYTPAELARSLGIGRRRLLRLLKMYDIFVYEMGTSVFVPLSEIKDKLGPLWASLRVNDGHEDHEVDESRRSLHGGSYRPPAGPLGRGTS